ncbi:M23 family metallopeptidase [Pedobacter metabolipauper]|uniref:Peptidase M23-like protein n=1 Tax=Pedobacter metabolipauper TaxID=425513 RepID=A0A4V3D1N1_9SPHI|nr:peptidoglycan DD-metalloendopeptidase family protein [Pedobacter metabolipauper]TDQ11863.1 peptidase M23-like protein [Pedobacter metabolipauper]
MKNILKLAALSMLLFSNLTIQAQEALVKVTARRNTNNSVDFVYEKPDPGTVTLILSFNDFTNTIASQKKDFTIKSTSGNVTTLTPTNKEQGIGYSYSYSYIRGKLNPKYDTEFVYILPCKKGSKVRPAESTFVGATFFGDTTPADWKVYTFFTETADTVTAIRKGIVVDVKDKFESDENANVEFSSKKNELIVEHADGTMATYIGFKKGSIPVKVGQTVFPGTILGVNSRSNVRSKFHSSIRIVYLKSLEFGRETAGTLQKSNSVYGFVTPHFYTAEGASVTLVPQQEYIGASTPEIIQKEFTKKELKSTVK